MSSINNIPLNMFCKCLGKRPLTVQTIIYRVITTTEVSTALRPFYFTVHPDLFGQHPNQRAINENSLKHLSSFIECLQKGRPVQPLHLQFYVRNKGNGDGSFKLINIQLKDKDLRKTVINILKSIGLSTEYIDGLPKPEPPKENVMFKERKHHDIDFTNTRDNFFSGMVNIKRKIKNRKDTFQLKSWLENNYKDALAKSETQKPVREDIQRLQKEVLQKLNLMDLRWDCGWNEQHFKGCLQALAYLSEHYPEPMDALKGRVLVFAQFTGVSLDGHIMLNSGEVRHNWLDLIKNVKKYDEILLKIPVFERCVSQVLRNIKIGRRKFMPKILAGEYKQNLKKVTTSLNDYLSRRNFPEDWPETLENYELVVETESAPMMISPTGQLIVPASCPGTLLVNFISNSLQEATEKIEKYKTNKHLERSLKLQCVNDLQLNTLNKDDSVSPDIMIECCQRLLKHKHDVKHTLKDIHLNITNYYSVLSDGVVCIPWNWII